MDEDRCENCWWGYGIGGSCCHPRNSDKLDSEIVKPCGWFEPKLEKNEPDEGDMYDIYQKTVELRGRSNKAIDEISKHNKG